MFRSPNKAGSDSDLPNSREFQDMPPSKPLAPQTRSGKHKRTLDITVDEKFSNFEEKISQMILNLKDDIDTKFKTIESKLSNIQKNTGDIEKSLEFLSTGFEEMADKVLSLEKQVKDKQTQIDDLEDKFENLQRSARSSTVEIRNVPSSTNETKEILTDYVIQMSTKVGAKVELHDIKDVFRVPGKLDTNKPIIAELTTTLLKNRVIKAVKSYNVANKSSKLNAFHLGLRGHSSPVFVVEHLTSKGNRLYYLARELMRSGKYKYCWTSNGKVFVRKADGAPITLIKSEEQIEALKNLI